MMTFRFKKKLAIFISIFLLISVLIISAIVLSNRHYIFIFEENGIKKELLLNGWDGIYAFPVSNRTIWDAKIQEIMKNHPEKVRNAE